MRDRLFKIFTAFCLILTLVTLLVLFARTIRMGFSRLNGSFLTSLYSHDPAVSGIYTALTGTIWIVLLTCLIALPIGIGAGIYMEKYLEKSRWSRILEVNIINLAGVSPVIYGILGLEVFVRFFEQGNSILSGALTLSLMILPSIIVNTRECIQAVPDSLIEGSVALGASRWQTIERIVIPYGYPFLISSILKTISRITGTTAPLIVLGRLVYIPFTPQSLNDPYTTLPSQIYDWIILPQSGFARDAAAGIVILLLITFTFNILAVQIRTRATRNRNILYPAR